MNNTPNSNIVVDILSTFGNSGIPNDIVVDILTRLPVKTLCKCRCVSKPWRNIIEFVRMHLNNLEMKHLVADFKTTFFDEGYLGAQFTRLEKSENAKDPKIIERVMGLYSTKSMPLYIQNIEKVLESHPIDFSHSGMLYITAIQINGLSVSVGTIKVTEKTNKLLEYCKSENCNGCIETFKEIKHELEMIRMMLQNYFEIKRGCLVQEVLTIVGFEERCGAQLYPPLFLPS